VLQQDIFANCTISNNSASASSSAGGNKTHTIGTATITYSDVQDGYDGEGNINVNPVLGSCLLQILPGSLCTDEGNPDPQYNDVCFPLSMGAARNNMGAYGGPGACQCVYFSGETVILIVEEFPFFSQSY
jgi:hypothetical protein